MEQNTPTSLLAQAPGYATRLYTVDECLVWADMIRDQFSGAYAFCATSQDERFLVLADEVRRLRAVLGEIAACPEYIERRFIIELASDAVQSHNKGMSSPNA